MSVSSDNLSSQFSAEEWRSLGVLFAVAARIAMADGSYDDEEQDLETRLLHGMWPFPLDPQVHQQLDSEPHLAREVLTLERGAVLSDLAAGGDLMRGMDAPKNLDAWIDRADGPEEQAKRRALARGVLFEAINVSAQVACANGEASDNEVAWLRETVARLGVDPGEAHFICVASCPAYEAAFSPLMDSATAEEPTVDELTGFATIGETRYSYTATSDGFEYEPAEAPRSKLFGRRRDSGGYVPADRVAVLRVMPMGETQAFAMFAGGMEAEDVFLSMNFWGEDATQRAAEVGFMLGARVFKGE